MINNTILLIWLLLISIFYWKKHTEAALVSAFTLCILAPTIVIGDTRLNAAYLISAVLFILLGADAVVRKKWPLVTKGESRTLLVIFIITRAVAILAFFIGYLQNGTAGFGTMVRALLGNVNLSLLTVLLAYMGLQVPKKRYLPVIYKTAVITAAVNLVFMLLQRYAFDFGFRLTYDLFMSPDRVAPLETMREIGYFARTFGSFFTPTVLGTTFLYLIVILAAWFLTRPGFKINWPVFAVIGILTYIGINSFSKLIVLGLPAMIVFWLLALLLLKAFQPIKLSNFWVFAAAALLIFVVSYYVFPDFARNSKRYYYGLIWEPIASLATRYQPPAPPEPGVIDSGETPTDMGKTISALQEFFKHPVFGVGPVAVGDEFIGDSQITSALHHGGIVAALSYLVFFVYTFIRAIRFRNLMVISLIAAIFIGSVASGTLDYRHTTPFVAFLIMAAGAADASFGPDPETEDLGWSGRTVKMAKENTDA